MPQKGRMIGEIEKNKLHEISGCGPLNLPFFSMFIACAMAHSKNIEGYSTANKSYFARTASTTLFD